MIKNVVEYLVKSAEDYPDKIALIDENGEYSFREVDYKAKQVATAISLTTGGAINQPIAVYMPKGIDCIVAFMGILYSGNFYSPLDTKTPSERIQKIVNVLEPEMVLYSNELPEDVLISSRAVSLPQLYESIVDDNAVKGYKRVLDIDPIYTLFTSGSTGQPKGVVISHRGVIDYIEWLADAFGFNSSTVFGNQAPFYFDNSILDIYSTFRNASTMVILPERGFAFPRVLVEFMNEKKVNTLFWVPSAMISMANSRAIEEYTMKYLEKVLFCGEVMPNKQLNLWRKKYPAVLYANLYGPTEITDVCSYYIVDRDFADEEMLPIGKSCENMELIILNEDNKQVMTNEVGELCVRGIGLSMGYYRDWDRTEKVFIQNPLNQRYREIIYRTGDLVKLNEREEILYIGRKDFQIKHQGHRIELGEIEAATVLIEGIDMCGAIYDGENRQIIIFVTVRTGISEKTIYQELKKKIPAYMLPSKIFILEKMPLNLNGKIDRPALKNNYMR